MYSQQTYRFVVNLKFMEIESMKGLLGSFQNAEELHVVSKNYDSLEETLNDAGTVTEDLRNQLQALKLGNFKIDVQRNFELVEVDEEEQTEELATELEEYDPEEWRENEVMKIWLYEVDSHPELIIPVALIQIFRDTDTQTRVLS